MSGTDTIDFITISTLGNAQDFGDLTAAGAIQESKHWFKNQNVILVVDIPLNAIDFITCCINRKCN